MSIRFKIAELIAGKKSYNPGNKTIERQVNIAAISNMFIPSSGIGYPSFANLFQGDKYPGALSIPATPSELDWKTIQGRARNIRWDSTIAASLKKRLDDNVVNTGLKLESSPVWEICAPNWNDEKRAQWVKNVETRWHLYCMDKRASYNEMENFYQIQNLWFSHRFIDGEAFVFFRYLDDRDRLNPLSVELVDPDQIVTIFDHDFYREAEKNGNEIRDGIEFDSRGREVAFFVHNVKGEVKRIPKFGPNSNRQFVLHSFDREKLSIARGISEFAGFLHELQKITDLSVSELQATLLNSIIAAAIERTGDAEHSAGFDALGGGVRDEYQPIPDDTKTSEPRKTEWKYPGILIDTLNSNEKINSFKTERPNINVDVHITSILKRLSASIGQPVEVVDLLFSQNYSASRAALILFWNNVIVRRARISSDLIAPAFAMWMLGEIESRNVEAPGFNSPYIRAAWLNFYVVGIPKPSIDPAKESLARRIILSEGLSTRERESRELNGTSYDDNMERITRENQQLADAIKPLSEIKKM